MKKNIKNKITRRLKVLEGQIRGLQNMIKEDKYCIDIINQSSAVKQALSSVENLIMEEHLSTCVIKQIKDKKESKAIKEILNVYKLSKNK
ncbi:MAG: metal-sensitive transcriptional regulator [Patescibacteria group bacterium]